MPEPPQPRRAHIGWATFLATTLVFTLAWYFKPPSTPNVRFILPVNYRGPFWLYKTPTGQPPRLLNHTPPNGVACVTDLSFLQRWHTTSAADAAGHLIFEGDKPSTPPDTYVYELWSGTAGPGPNAPQWVHCFVGSPAEKEAASKAARPSDDMAEIKRRLAK